VAVRFGSLSVELIDRVDRASLKWIQPIRDNKVAKFSPESITYLFILLRVTSSPTNSSCNSPLMSKK